MPVECAGAPMAAASPVLDLLASVCPLPAARFAEVRTTGALGRAGAPAQRASLDALKAEAVRMLRASRFDPCAQASAAARGSAAEEVPRVSSAMTLARVLGFGPGDAESARGAVADCVADVVAGNSVIRPWADAGCGASCSGVAVRVSPRTPFGFGYSPRPAAPAARRARSAGAARPAGAPEEASVTVASCRSSTRTMLDRVNDRCARLLGRRAYTQYYEGYACPAEAIGDALEVSRAVADSYAGLGL